MGWSPAVGPQLPNTSVPISPQTTDGKRACRASCSAFPIGWPDVALRLCFCKTADWAFSGGGSPSLQKPWEEVGWEAHEEGEDGGWIPVPGTARLWGGCPELLLVSAVMWKRVKEKKACKFSLSHKLNPISLFGTVHFRAFSHILF